MPKYTSGSQWIVKFGENILSTAELLQLEDIHGLTSKFILISQKSTVKFWENRSRTCQEISTSLTKQ